MVVKKKTMRRRSVRKNVRKSVRRNLKKSSKRNVRKSVRMNVQKSSKRNVRKSFRRNSKRNVRKSVRRNVRKSVRRNLRKSRRGGAKLPTSSEIVRDLVMDNFFSNLINVRNIPVDNFIPTSFSKKFSSGCDEKFKKKFTQIIEILNSYYYPKKEQRNVIIDSWEEILKKNVFKNTDDVTTWMECFNNLHEMWKQQSAVSWRRRRHSFNPTAERPPSRHTPTPPSLGKQRLRNIMVLGVDGWRAQPRGT